MPTKNSQKTEDSQTKTNNEQSESSKQNQKQAQLDAKAQPQSLAEAATTGVSGSNPRVEQSAKTPEIQKEEEAKAVKSVDDSVENAKKVASENEELRLEQVKQDAERKAPKFDVAGSTPVAGTAPDKPVDQPTKKTLNKEDLDQLKYNQSVDPDTIKLIPGNKDENYKFPETEQNMVHVEMERRVFDSQTGAKRSKPYVQKFWPQEYADSVERNGFVGYTVTVKHKPEALDQVEQLKAKRKQAKAQQ